jgi:ATP-dependent protease HslVU (ClpYQ) ATPase subunit
VRWALIRFFCKLLFTLVLIAALVVGALYIAPVSLFMLDPGEQLNINSALPLSHMNVLLLGVDNVSLEFDDSALTAIAECAWHDNETSENIGARRLHTLMESILSDIAFNAGGGDAPEVCVHIDAEYVRRMLGTDLHRKDVRKYII